MGLPAPARRCSGARAATPAGVIVAPDSTRGTRMCRDVTARGRGAGSISRSQPRADCNVQVPWCKPPWDGLTTLHGTLSRLQRTRAPCAYAPAGVLALQTSPKRRPAESVNHGADRPCSPPNAHHPPSLVGEDCDARRQTACSARRLVVERGGR